MPEQPTSFVHFRTWRDGWLGVRSALELRTSPGMWTDPFALVSPGIMSSHDPLHRRHVPFLAPPCSPARDASLYALAACASALRRRVTAAPGIMTLQAIGRPVSVAWRPFQSDTTPIGGPRARECFYEDAGVTDKDDLALRSGEGRVQPRRI
jgi:hypothetical protein